MECCYGCSAYSENSGEFFFTFQWFALVFINIQVLNLEVLEGFGFVWFLSAVFLMKSYFFQYCLYIYFFNLIYTNT